MYQDSKANFDEKSTLETSASQTRYDGLFKFINFKR